AHRPLRVVLVRAGDPEGGHHSITGELLDRAAVRLDAARHLLEEARYAPPHDLRIAAAKELRRPHEVDEKHGRKLPPHDLKSTERRGRTLPRRPPPNVLVPRSAGRAP